MAEALSLYSDSCCPCSAASQSGGGGGVACCIYPLHGTEDPNVSGIVPPYSPDKIWTYEQWIDPILGPSIQTLKWNPNISQWQ